MPRVRTATVLAMVVRERNQLLHANSQWAEACAGRDTTIQKLQDETVALKQELEQPKLRFVELHPEIQTRCQKLFENGHLEEAIATAMKAIEVQVRSRIKGDPTDIGVPLMSKAMTGDDPHICHSTVSSEQEAAHHLFRGAIGWFRNPVMHRFHDNKCPASAFEVLAFASSLLRMLDEADTRTS